MMGKEAALFVISGTMAQQIAIQAHDEAAAVPAKTFLCHPTSHLLLHESDAYAELCGFEAVQSGEATLAISAASVEAALEQRRSAGLPLPTTLLVEMPQTYLLQ